MDGSTAASSPQRLMPAASGETPPSPVMVLIWGAILIGLPAFVASQSVSAPQGSQSKQSVGAAATPPPVLPLTTRSLDRDTARRVNAAVPFAEGPNPSARPFRFSGDALAFQRAADCLSAAMIYEAGDDEKGQRAVAQVIINRLRHPAFPNSVCDVVFQGSERTTGCQFTFTCDGAMQRRPSRDVWDRAQQVAKSVLSGAIFPTVGHATHYHTDWVVPYWSDTLDKIVAVDTHLFFRWRGWWGTPAAFRGKTMRAEPIVPVLASLSVAHGGPLEFVQLPAPKALPTISLEAEGTPLPMTVSNIGDRFGAGILTAINQSEESFALHLDAKATPDSFERSALIICRGRSLCRVLGWTRTDHATGPFPISEARLATMSYAYLRDAESNLQRSLWNCTQYSGITPAQCMRGRANPTPKPAPRLLSSGASPGS